MSAEDNWRPHASRAPGGRDPARAAVQWLLLLTAPVAGYAAGLGVLSLLLAAGASEGSSVSTVAITLAILALGLAAVWALVLGMAFGPARRSASAMVRGLPYASIIFFLAAAAYFLLGSF